MHPALRRSGACTVSIGSTVATFAALANHGREHEYAATIDGRTCAGPRRSEMRDEVIGEYWARVQSRHT